MRAGRIGLIASPRDGHKEPGVRWCADNGSFAGNYKGDRFYLGWLAKRDNPELCEFATAPDVVCDPAATLERSLPVLPRIRELGLPAALVAQNGLEDMDIPYGQFDVLFLGGDTEWKLGKGAAGLTAAAVRHGKRVHMGRVNSLVRLRYAHEIGCTSADGTFLAFGPAKNLPQLLWWLEIVSQPSLFDDPEVCAA
jgi:hypothetical protein